VLIRITERYGLVLVNPTSYTEGHGFRHVLGDWLF